MVTSAIIPAAMPACLSATFAVQDLPLWRQHTSLKMMPYCHRDIPCFQSKWNHLLWCLWYGVLQLILSLIIGSLWDSVQDDTCSCPVDRCWSLENLNAWRMLWQSFLCLVLLGQLDLLHQICSNIPILSKQCATVTFSTYMPGNLMTNLITSPTV